MNKENEIIDYIKENHKFLKSKNALERQLKNAGYKDEEIQKAYSKFLEYNSFSENSNLERKEKNYYDEPLGDVDRKLKEEIKKIDDDLKQVSNEFDFDKISTEIRKFGYYIMIVFGLAFLFLYLSIRS